jgi:hypothetical protein
MQKSRARHATFLKLPALPVSQNLQMPIEKGKSGISELVSLGQMLAESSSLSCFAVAQVARGQLDQSTFEMPEGCYLKIVLSAIV